MSRGAGTGLRGRNRHGARDDERDVAEARAESFADADRDEKVPDRDATLGGRQTIQMRGREHQAFFLERLPRTSSDPVAGVYQPRQPLLVLERARERDAARDAGRVDRRRHAHEDAETEYERQRRPWRPSPWWELHHRSRR